MPFTHLSHGDRHLRIASDEGHQFVFCIVRDGREARMVIDAPRWRGECRPTNHSDIVDEARRFAAVCAQDFGLR